MATETATRIRPGSDNTESATHLICRLCSPESYLGMPALCGEKLLGIDAPVDADTCPTCLGVWEDHFGWHIEQGDEVHW